MLLTVNNGKVYKDADGRDYPAGDCIDVTDIEGRILIDNETCSVSAVVPDNTPNDDDLELRKRGISVNGHTAEFQKGGIVEKVHGFILCDYSNMGQPSYAGKTLLFTHYKPVDVFETRIEATLAYIVSIKHAEKKKAVPVPEPTPAPVIEPVIEKETIKEPETPVTPQVPTPKRGRPFKSGGKK